MGKSVHCRECGKVYRELDELEDLRDNDSVCLVCNNTVEVADWDRILASFEDEDGDVEEVDEDDWDDEEDEEEDEDLEVDKELEEDFEDDVDVDDDEDEEEDDDEDEDEEEDEEEDDERD